MMKDIILMALEHEAPKMAKWENVFFKLKVQNIATLIITPEKTAASKRTTVGSLNVRFCVK